MSAMHAATFYVGLNLLILLALIILVIIQRRKHKIVLGDGGELSLKLAIRAHANAVEVMPLALIGLVALASVSAPTLVIHILGAILTLGRALHGYGLSRAEGPSFGRMTGMLLSLLALLGTAVMCVMTGFLTYSV